MLSLFIQQYFAIKKKKIIIDSWPIEYNANTHNWAMRKENIIVD